MHDIIKNKLFVYALSIASNIVLFLFILYQINSLNSLNQFWQDNASHQTIKASHLASLEKKLGYTGFIHNFKNYVIRGDEKYYLKSKGIYAHAMASLASLRELSSDEETLRHLDAVERTVNEYYKNVELIAQSDLTLSVDQIDDLVKVDDTAAEASLNSLRDNILQDLESQKESARQQLKAFKQNTYFYAWVLFPFFLMSCLTTIFFLNRLLHTSTELATIFNHSPDGVLYVDDKGKIIKANSIAATIFGYPDNEMLSLRVEDLIDSKLRDRHKHYRKDFSKEPQSREMAERLGSIQGLKKDGSYADLNISISSHDVGGHSYTVCIIRDISHRLMLENAAIKDHLTDLHNRRYFDDVMKIEMERCQREKGCLSLILIDLDHFKELNDEHGHEAGDLALQEVSKFLQANSRSYDHLARWGGDEFALLCPGLNAEDALLNAQRVWAAFNDLKAHWKYELTLSVGIASTGPAVHKDAQTLLHEADEALYEVKKSGRNGVMHINLCKQG